MTVDIDGRTFELRQESAVCSKIYIDGEILQGYELNYAENHPPTEAQQKAFLENLARQV